MTGVKKFLWPYRSFHISNCLAVFQIWVSFSAWQQTKRASWFTSVSSILSYWYIFLKYKTCSSLFVGHRNWTYCPDLQSCRAFTCKSCFQWSNSGSRDRVGEGREYEEGMASTGSNSGKLGISTAQLSLELEMSVSMWTSTMIVLRIISGTE